MNLMEEITSNAGVEYLEKSISLEEDLKNPDNFYITEGLVFFKTSKRLEKYIKKLEKKNKDGAIDILINKLKDTRANFVKVEAMHKNGERKKAKELYKKLRTDNVGIVRMMRKDSMKKALITAGVAGLALTAVGFAVYGMGGFGIAGAKIASGVGALKGKAAEGAGALKGKAADVFGKGAEAPGVRTGFGQDVGNKAYQGRKILGANKIRTLEAIPATPSDSQYLKNMEKMQAVISGHRNV